MASTTKSTLETLGTLRNSLIFLCFVNIFFSIIYLLQFGFDPAEAVSDWQKLSAMIPPVMAPIFLVVILIDFIMSKVRGSDEPSDAGAPFRAIARIERNVMLISLLYWVPYIIWLI
ncbi:MAG: hypothetical protein ACI845_004183 [Gammaproteobacteria bacterium]|jgi:hypothetical protein